MRCFLALVALSGCRKDPADSGPADPGVGEGLFAEGCPAPGRALARVIGVDAALPGKAAVGTAGDLLLANRRAAFVITDAVGQSTYWYYGGALADAAPMDGCAPGEDKLDDLGFVFAELDLLEVEQSIIRAFRADRVEVIADGADGGPAVVRATGTDDVHWLVEHTLINEAASSGGRRPFSAPWGLEITVDYVLPPDSPVLEIDISVRNPGPEPLTVFEAALLSWGETLTRYATPSDRVSLGGFGFDAGIPVIVATDGAGAYAFGADDANPALITLAGVNVVVDLGQVVDGFELGPGEQAAVQRLFAVGDGSGASSIRPLLEQVTAPLRDQPADPGTVRGALRGPEGPVQGVVRVDARADGADWATLDRVPTGLDGSFEAVVPAFSAGWSYRVVGEGPGRDPGAPVEVSPGDAGVSVSVGAVGSLDFAIRDQDGADSPARLVLDRSDGARITEWVAGSGSIPVPPGTWSWTATRGYEYAWATGEVTIPDGGRGALDATLVHVVDTTGWMSIDTHVHSSDSPDSDTPQVEVLRRAAGNGLDVVLHTEHEHIVDRSTVPADAGVEAWTTNLTGEEVTHVGVEHMTMFPAEPDGSPRGGYVEWYGMDIDQLFGVMRQRSGNGVNLLNHPGYLDRIQWDRVRAAPLLDDPTLLGLQPDQALWSWNFDGIEVMNGHGDIFATGNRRFDNWMSMVNAGHPVVAVGCSDDHGAGSVGFPRSYFASGTDDPRLLDVGELIDAFLGGQVLVSAGAFARVDVGGEGPGAVVTDTDGMVDLHVEIEAVPDVDLTHFAVFANCDMVDSVRATDPLGVVKYDGVVPINVVGDTQLVIAGFGAEPLPPGLPQYDATRTPRVLTNPIYIDGDGDGLFTAPGGRECAYDLSEAAAR